MEIIMEKYLHKVAYYETDKMGITHHSNYIRWMEEARVDFLDKVGWGFRKMEESGLASPVLNIQCSYKRSTTFDDTVEITTYIKEIGTLRMTIGYEMRKAGESEIVCTGFSEHCFFGNDGRPVRLEKDLPDFYAAMRAHLRV